MMYSNYFFDLAIQDVSITYCLVCILVYRVCMHCVAEVAKYTHLLYSSFFQIMAHILYKNQFRRLYKHSTLSCSMMVTRGTSNRCSAASRILSALSIFPLGILSRPFSGTCRKVGAGYGTVEQTLCKSYQFHFKTHLQYSLNCLILFQWEINLSYEKHLPIFQLWF